MSYFYLEIEEVWRISILECFLEYILSRSKANLQKGTPFCHLPDPPLPNTNKKTIQTTCPNLPVWNLSSQPLWSLPCQDSLPSLSAMRIRIWWMTEKDKCHMIPCIYEILKKKSGYRWTYLQNRNRVTGVESKLTVIRGKEGGRGKLGGWDGHIQTRYIK